MSHGSRIAVSLLALALASAPVAADSGGRANELADELMEALGGEEAWQEARFFQFTFAGFRRHWWDRFEGRHRLEFTSRDGERYLVLQDLDSRQGKVWIDGEPVAGERADEALENAYAAWINDTYWLIAPYKLRDPGVKLDDAGEETLDGVTYDTLQLTFDVVGLTPGDTYWFYLDRDSGLPGRWAYVLESWEEDRPPTHWRWLEWQRHGGVMLSALRVDPNSGRELPLGDIAVPPALPDAVFESPEPVAE